MKILNNTYLKSISRLVIFSSICLLFKSCSLFLFDFGVQMEFEYYWDDEKIGLSDLGVTEFTTENGTVIVMNDMQYILSQIQIEREGKNEVYLLEEQRVASQLTRWYTTVGDVPHDDYKISFVFGLSEEFNVYNPTIDLPDSFLVPEQFGGGYNFMHLNGSYQDSNGDFQPFEFHVTNAVNNAQPNNVIIEDSSFVVDLGTHYLSGGPFYAIIKVKVNVAEWFKGPHDWDFNQLNSGLTTNYDAQILIKENGQNVFTLDRIYAD